MEETDGTNRLSLAASGFAVAVGGAVLVGWALDIAVLKSMLPGFVSMKANTALCFMLVGFALWQLARVSPGPRAAVLSRACAWAMVAIASLTMVQYALGLDLGIDQLLIRQGPASSGLEHPGRMAPATCVSLLMLGLALLLSGPCRAEVRSAVVQNAVQLLGLMAGSIGLLVTIGYVYGAQSLGAVGAWTRMSLLAALTMLVASSGILALFADRGLVAVLTTSRVGGVAARRLLPVAVVTLIAFGWLHLKGEESGMYGHELGIALLVSATVVVAATSIGWTASSMNRMDARRIKAEDTLRRNARELAARNRIAEVFLTVPDEEMYASVLAIVLDTTESEFGVFGYLDDSGSLVVPTMTRTVWEKCQVPDKRFVFPGSAWGNSAWPRAIREKMTICLNEPSTLTPPGHIAITRHVSMPLIHHGEAVGLVQVANKDVDYTGEDVALLETIGQAIAPVLRERLKREGHEATRRQAEKALQESEERFQRLSEATLEGIVIHEEGKILDVNHSFADLFGYEVRETIGKDVLELAAPQSRDLVLSRILAGSEEAYEAVGQRRNGSTFAGELLGRAIPYHGRTVRVTAVRDITERKRAEEALATSQKLLQDITDNSISLIYALDLEGRFLLINRRLESVLGVPRDSMIAKTREAVLPLDVAAAHRANDLQVIEKRLPMTFEEEHDAPDGKHTYLSVKFPLLDSRGEPHGIGGISTDITERKRAEDELRVALSDLKRSNEDLEQFAYVASHDLQEPLRMVSSYTQLLAQRYGGELDDRALKYIDYAVDGATRMQRLIRDLLMYSRVGTRGRSPEPTDLHSVLGEALRNLAAAIQENCAIVTNDDLPTLRVDPAQLAQVFQNLIGNAIKFRRPDEPPHVHIAARQVTGETDTGKPSVHQGTRRPQSASWLFAIQDNGIGIDPKFEDRLFVIFRRLHTQQEYPGTGIGLALCKRIIEQHRGRIWFESEPGKGSTFYFTLPR